MPFMSMRLIRPGAWKRIITVHILQRVQYYTLTPEEFPYPAGNNIKKKKKKKEGLTGFIIDVRQCLLYDSDKANAKLLGVEYMVTPRLFKTLPAEERRLWHTHQYEVKSGMLIMPSPAGVPNPVWEAAETAEMRDVLPLYGKVYHFWQVDRGHPVPMGEPQLMGSFLSEDRVKLANGGKGLSDLVKERDERFGVDTAVKAEKRKDIEGVEKDPGESSPMRL